MKKKLIVLFLLVLLGNLQGIRILAKKPAKIKNFTVRKTVRLFNKKNLDGWYVFIKGRGRDQDVEKVFTVKEGLLQITGKEYGCITTTEEYENYELEVEFKWGDKTFEPRVNAARDNGILIHSQGADGGFSGTWMHSIECQIIEGGTGDFLVVGDGTTKFSITCPVAAEKQNGTNIYRPDGDTVTINRGRVNWFGRDAGWKDVKNFRGAKDIEKRVGKWNKVRIVAKADDIYFYLNGVLVNRAMRVKPSKGRIQIQSEGAEMFVRKVELSPLSGQ
jgi:hypothetical protein